MSARLLRSTLIGAAAAAVTVAAASTAGAATVSLKVSSGYAWAGGSVTATVTSSEDGTISLYQLRSAAKQSGPGRCFLDQGFLDGRTFPLGRPVATVTVEAGRPAAVGLWGGKLAFFGGNLMDGMFTDHGPEGCADPPTRYLKLGAFLDAGPYADDGHDVRSLTRVL